MASESTSAEQCDLGPNDKCYVCGNSYDGALTRRHDEHIIQNAIGGKLTSNRVVCESCGGKLGDSIDTPFSGELVLFNVLHGTDRDRDFGNAGAKIEVLTKITPKGIKESTRFRLCEDYRILPNHPIYFED